MEQKILGGDLPFQLFKEGDLKKEFGKPRSRVIMFIFSIHIYTPTLASILSVLYLFNNYFFTFFNRNPLGCFN